MVSRDLWSGADVQWVGPERKRRGVRLRPGDRAVVIDAGPHQLTSFSTFQITNTGTAAPRPTRGVLIRLPDGQKVSVPRKHLKVSSAEHPLAPEPDAALADWWLEQLIPWGREGVPIASLVPSGFPAVGQVLHPWWGRSLAEGGPTRWQELAEQHGFASVDELDQTRAKGSIPAARDAGVHACEGELDALTATALVEVLREATSSPDDVFVAVWTGWGDVPAQRFPGAVHLDTQARGHFLLRGPLDGVLTSVAVSHIDRPTAGLWWPADRAWFVATEIDFMWTFVAGSDQLIDRLVAEPRLEVAVTSFKAPANKAANPS